MEGLPTRSSEISPFFSSKRNWESQASNNSGGPVKGQTLMVSSLSLGLQKTHLTLNMDNGESLWLFQSHLAQSGGQGKGVGGPH